MKTTQTNYENTFEIELWILGQNEYHCFSFCLLKRDGVVYKCKSLLSKNKRTKKTIYWKRDHWYWLYWCWLTVKTTKKKEMKRSKKSHAKQTKWSPNEMRAFPVWFWKDKLVVEQDDKWLVVPFLDGQWFSDDRFDLNTISQWYRQQCSSGQLMNDQFELWTHIISDLLWCLRSEQKRQVEQSWTKLNFKKGKKCNWKWKTRLNKRCILNGRDLMSKGKNCWFGRSDKWPPPCLFDHRKTFACRLIATGFLRL